MKNVSAGDANRHFSSLLRDVATGFFSQRTFIADSLGMVSPSSTLSLSLNRPF